MVLFLADYLHRKADGPDPAELPRRRRRMRIAPRTAFHLADRRDRPPVHPEVIRDFRRAVSR